MIVSLAVLAISLTIVDHFKEEKLMWAVTLAIVSVLTYVSTFSLGMGPVGWVYLAEVFPLRLRAQGTGMGVAMQRVMSGVISMTFLSLSKAVTIGGAFFIFMAMAMIGCLFIYTLLPETQGKTLEELQDLFGTFFKWRSTMRELEKNKPFNRDDGNGNGQVQLGERHG